MKPRAIYIFLGLAVLSPSFLQSFDFDNLDVGKVISGGSKLVKASKGLTDAEEMKLGREVAANLAARYGFVDDEAQVRYLNLVGQAVVRRCDRRKIPYYFAILRTSEINAMAAPGGYVFVTQGLLDSLKDESELAGVLAHEITHITRQHIVKAIRQAHVIDAGEDLASATGHDVDGYGKLSDFSIDLLSNGLSRGDELEADQEGTLLAAKVGYDALGLKRSIETLKEREKSDRMMARFSKTHPPASDRLEALDRVIKKHKISSSGSQNVDRFSRKSAI